MSNYQTYLKKLGEFKPITDVPGLNSWGCTVLDDDPLCQQDAVYWTDLAHGDGLCMYHAWKLCQDAGYDLYPELEYIDTLGEKGIDVWEIPWVEVELGEDWHCTVFVGKGVTCGITAIAKGVGTTAGLCKNHARWFIPYNTLKSMTTTHEKLSVTAHKWSANHGYPYLGCSHSLGGDYVSLDHPQCGTYATHFAEHNGKQYGLCPWHAEMYGLTFSFNLGWHPEVGMYQHWMPCTTAACTIVGCGNMSVAMHPTGNALCIVHAPYWIPPKYLKKLVVGEPVQAKAPPVLTKAKPKVKVKAKAGKKVRHAHAPKDEALSKAWGTTLYFPFEEDATPSGGHSPAEIEAIGLVTDLDIRQAAAEWYLLMDASLAPESEAQREAARQFKALTDFLAAQMSLYIECACLGEARYAASRVTNANERRFLANPKLRGIYSEICSGAFHRYMVWAKFPEYARRYGRRNLLLFTVLVHDTLNWKGGGYGGKKWGQCAKTVLAYRRKRIDKVTFVDTAFGLKHNGNIVFDKLWKVSGVEDILDANQRGDMDRLCLFASAEVVELWKKVNEASALVEVTV